VKISNLKKEFENFSVCIDELDIPKGIMCGIMGPNGCGKTTAMKMMAGVLKPDSGAIDFEGLTKKEITMVFRKPYLLRDTVLSNLLYPLKIRGIKPDSEMVEHYLELAGLQEMKGQYALNLSGGEQQKLSLIRALIFDPKLIFVDEAFSNMDIESVSRFEEYIIKRQEKKPITWVIVNHQLTILRRLCEQIHFMAEGRVVVSGTPDDLLSSPTDERLLRFLQYL